MRTTRPVYGQRTNRLGVGPQLAFAAAIFAGLVAWTSLLMTVAANLVAPLVATLLFVFAAALAVVAWPRDEQSLSVTYADVAGALTLIGLCVAATIEPEQAMRIVERDSTPP